MWIFLTPNTTKPVDVETTTKFVADKEYNGGRLKIGTLIKPLDDCVSFDTKKVFQQIV